MFVVMAEIMALCAVFSLATAKRANCGLRWALWHSAAGDCLRRPWQRYGTLDLRLLDMRMNSCRSVPTSGCSCDWLWPARRDYSAARLGAAAGKSANASAPAAALFSHGSHEIGLLAILTPSLAWAVMHRCGGGSRCWCSA
ncbi:hypothetical protein ACLK1S_16825 [Escherichia coli]